MNRLQFEARPGLTRFACCACSGSTPESGLRLAQRDDREPEFPHTSGRASPSPGWRWRARACAARVRRRARSRRRAQHAPSAPLRRRVRCSSATHRRRGRSRSAGALPLWPGSSARARRPHPSSLPIASSGRSHQAGRAYAKLAGPIGQSWQRGLDAGRTQTLTLRFSLSLTSRSLGECELVSAVTMSCGTHTLVLRYVSDPMWFRLSVDISWPSARLRCQLQ